MYESVPLKSVQTSSRFNDSHYLVVHETLVVMHAVYLTVCILFSLENTAHKTDQLYINLQWWQCKVSWSDRAGLEQANYFTTSTAKSVHSH